MRKNPEFVVLLGVLAAVYGTVLAAYFVGMLLLHMLFGRSLA